jgi:D-serine deaminase-like pyridoxal phosphate-dependent protein
MADYRTYKTALQNERLPAAMVDLDLLEKNAQDILKRAGNMRIRIASKSVRCRRLIEHLFKYSSCFQGLMTFTAEETLFLAQQGLDDFLLGYPTTDRVSVEALLKLNKKVTFMVDSKEQIQFLASFGPSVRVCLDIDMSTPFPGLWFGVRRSPLRTLHDVQQLISDLPTQVQVKGLMGYEAQIAGLGNRGVLGPIIRFLQRRSHADYARRRGEIVAWLKQHHSLDLVNGGGTGSLEWSSQDPGVDEVTVGSGFYSPALFDHYVNFHHAPAAFFAVALVRQPAPGMWTALGGGYTASGEINVNKRPAAYLPAGVKLVEQEGCGEVQTPFTYTGLEKLNLGDPVFFRHAKAGELCERFNEVLLLKNGKIFERVPTYRGEGKSFL